MHLFHFRAKVEIILQHFYQLLHQKSILVFHQFAELFYLLRHDFALLAAAAARECLTNLVRHANGTRLEIFGEATANGWEIRYLNDGDAPSHPIVEGSGLSSLRAQVEAAGGAMAVEHAPRFRLTLILPQERREAE